MHTITKLGALGLTVLLAACGGNDSSKLIGAKPEGQNPPESPATLAGTSVTGMPVAGDPNAALLPTQVDATTVPALQSIAGVWATNDAPGDDRETVLRILSDGQVFRFNINGDTWQARVEDVDAKTGIITLKVKHPPHEGALDEVLSLRLVPARAGSNELPRLKLTWEAGQVTELNFVRRMAAPDITLAKAPPPSRAMRAQEDDADERDVAVAAAAVDGPGVNPDTDVETCAEASRYLMRAVCRDPQLMALRVQFESEFERAVQDDGAARSSFAAARRQVEQCSNSECIRQTYGRWISYVGKTWPANL